MRERSVSGELEDSELGSPQENGNDDTHSGKPGRKKNPNSQAARRDQNRIAQREFRLRKQQRIRDLEARVEILSGGKDEAISEMRNILKDLMSENQVLRNLLKSLSGFIGDGAGGLLPKLGWSLQDFESFINRSETDTAWEGYQRRKTEGTAAAGPGARKRPSEDDGLNRAKRPREEGASNETFPSLVSMNAMASSSTMYNSTSRSPQNENSLFSDLMRGSAGSPMFMPNPSSGTSINYGTSSSQVGPPSNGSGYLAPSLAPINANLDAPMPSMSYVGSTSGPVQPSRMGQTQNIQPVEEPDTTDPKSSEAQKLISAYCLPASLRPTLVQRTVPHESVIDRVPHPELRDRLILLRGRFNLVDCLHDYGQSVTIHGDDVLAHANWEIDETWLRRYGFLVDQNTLNISNRWRRERGLPELRLTDIAPTDQSTPTV
ncbi:hypothetical protein EWM64_g4610 [Hericium alpestre]|uniref:BZIP domain-containing protein n=1 Tax=Hericium alpestre TaxID=135208 RepID=A0A4Y9ZZC2_9AGAM|nr:hypothetical protein EWM64_g4610 [Hericium alpestre]